METRSPVVPGKPSFAVDSSLRVRPASTATSPGDAQNVVSITSDVRSDRALTSASVVLSRVSVSFTSSFPLFLKAIDINLVDFQLERRVILDCRSSNRPFVGIQNIRARHARDLVAFDGGILANCDKNGG